MLVDNTNQRLDMIPYDQNIEALADSDERDGLVVLHVLSQHSNELQSLDLSG